MTLLATIKTRASALAAIDAIEIPKTPAAPAPLKEGASEAAKAKFDWDTKEFNRVSEYVSRKTSLVNALKDLVKSRLAALPDSVETVGLDVRCDTGDIEMISVRIISHK